MTKVNLQTETKKFLEKAHRLWVSDFGDMNDYMTCLWALMIEAGVNWKSIVEMDTETMTRSISKGFETETMFEYDINDNSKDDFTVFAQTCSLYMDFSNMYSLNQERRVA